MGPLAWGLWHGAFWSCGRGVQPAHRQGIAYLQPAVRAVQQAEEARHIPPPSTPIPTPTPTLMHTHYPPPTHPTAYRRLRQPCRLQSRSLVCELVPGHHGSHPCGSPGLACAVTGAGKSRGAAMALAAAAAVAAWPGAPHERCCGRLPVGAGQAAMPGVQPHSVVPAGPCLVGLPSSCRAAVAQRAQQQPATAGQSYFCPSTLVHCTAMSRSYQFCRHNSPFNCNALKTTHKNRA